MNYVDILSKYLVIKLVLFLVLLGGCARNGPTNVGRAQYVTTSAEEFWTITVEGAVFHPGVYTVDKGTTFLNMLKLVGVKEYPAARPHSALSRVRCSMFYDGEWMEFSLDASYYLENPENDFSLSDNSKIFVPAWAGL